MVPPIGKAENANKPSTAPCWSLAIEVKPNYGDDRTTSAPAIATHFNHPPIGHKNSFTAFSRIDFIQVNHINGHGHHDGE